MSYVQKRLGHSDVQRHYIYVHLTDDDLAEEYNKYLQYQEEK